MRIFLITFLLLFQIQYMNCSEFKHDLGALTLQTLFLGATALTNQPSLKIMPTPFVQIASLLISGLCGMITGSIENDMKKSAAANDNKVFDPLDPKKKISLKQGILTLRGTLKIIEIATLIGMHALALGLNGQLTDEKYLLGTGSYIALTQIANIVLLLCLKN